MADQEGTGMDGIAIVGMSGRFPAADSVDALWEDVLAAKVAAMPLSDEALRAAGIDERVLAEPHYVKVGYVVDGIDRFDAAFFGFTPREAETMDPQHRMLLECCHEALDDAGHAPERYTGSIGVYTGVGTPAYMIRNLLPQPGLFESVGALQFSIGNEKSFASTKVSYKLNLRGPSVNVDTACSTSLVAVHQACQSLLAYECDMALAGGVSLNVPAQEGYFFHEGGIVSSDGLCRPFDHNAQGTVKGAGAGIVALKRLEDAIADGDHVYAVIKGSAINNDGAQKVGYTASSVDGQTSVISQALSLAGVCPGTIGYVEAHGTGTKLGDPVEIAALTEAYSTSGRRGQYCAVGSLKANLGHLDIAAGVAGLIKASKAVQTGVLPPCANFEAPNPNIDFAATPFYVTAETRRWPNAFEQRRAAVSSFGIGGTNAHVVLEQAPARPASTPARSRQLLVVSGKTAAAADRAVERLARHLEHSQDDLADAAYTLQVGRSHYPHRRAVVCTDRASAVAGLHGEHGRLKRSGPVQGRPQLVFMFPGQGSQYAGMCAGLYDEEPAFREALDACAEGLRPHLGCDIRDVVFAGEDDPRLRQTRYTQASLFCVEYSLAALLGSWGIEPDALIGHSVGEYVAACVGGVLSLQDALALIAGRGKLLDELPGGTMMIVPLPEDQAQAALAAIGASQAAIAVVNAPSLCVAAGPRDVLDRLAEHLRPEVECHVLQTSHAFHSPMMEPALPAFERLLAGFALSPPRIPIISNLTAKRMRDSEATDPKYWVRHLRQTVRFSESLASLMSGEPVVLLEVGPGTTLSTLAKQQPAAAAHHIVSCTRHPKDAHADLAVLLQAMGQLWLAGTGPDWLRFNARQRRLRVRLPTYPFERKRHWVAAPGQTLPADIDDAAAGDTGGPADATYVAPRDELEEAIVAIWQELFGIATISVEEEFFELGGHSLLAARILVCIEEQLGTRLPLAALFESPTVAGLAERVLLAQLEGTDEALLERMLSQVEASAEHAQPA